MKLLIRCPHCIQMSAVACVENWLVGEVLFTECTKCKELFTIRKNATGLVVFKDLRLPKPERETLKNCQLHS